MSELRKDYFLDRWVIISPKRGKRPHEFKYDQKEEEMSDAKCFFCPGNEADTPQEIGRVPDGNGSWKMRWFPNKFGAVKMEGQMNIKTDNKFYTFSDGYGTAEVIVETPDPKQKFWDLSVEDIKQVYTIYKDRIMKLESKPGIKYVNIFKNDGEDAGTSIKHSHSQVIALNHVPQEVQHKINSGKKCCTCPYCEILEIEKGSDRRCFENDTFVAFTPYASRFKYEIWLFPKRHVKRLEELNDQEQTNLAEIMKKILLKLKKINASYNYYLQYSPAGENLHFHVCIIPRLGIFAGFEFCSGIIINTVSPEDAAEFYRSCDQELI